MAPFISRISYHTRDDSFHAVFLMKNEQFSKTVRSVAKFVGHELYGFHKFYTKIAKLVKS